MTAIALVSGASTVDFVCRQVVDAFGVAPGGDRVRIW
jgi:hypothetical protein